MAFVDPTQPGQDPNQNQNPSQIDLALNPNATQQAQQQNQAAPPSTSSGGAGVASGGGGGAGASGTPSAGSKPSSSGSWTNLDSYLKANNDQAAQMGQQIAGNVNQAGDQAQSEISKLGTDFKAAVDQNTVQQNADAVNKAIGDANALKAGQSLSSDDQQNFNAQANANYGGPTDVTSFNGFNQAEQNVNSANQKANATKTEAGRGVLLNDQFQNASKYGYTQGENNLDQLLLENSEGAQSALQPLAAQWAGLTGALNSTVGAGATEAQNAVQTNQATSVAAKNALGTATKSFEDNLNTGLASLQKQDQDAYNAVLAALKAGDVAGANAAAQAAGINLGLDPSQHVYAGTDASGKPSGIDLTSYLTQGNQPTLGTFANADQYAQAAALAQLAGQQTSGFLSPAGISDAGTAQSTPAYSFNSAQEASDDAAAKATYDTTVKNVLNAANAGMGYDNITLNGAGAQNIDQAVTYLNNIVAWNSNGSPLANAEKGWALNQLNQLNQAQAANGFAAYPVYSGPGVPFGQPLPTGWASQTVQK